MPSEVHVLAGVIFDAENRVLLAQRPQGKDLAGLWEFPGGKIEPGETRHQALARELREELGIEIGPARPLTRIRHAYPHKTVLLDFWAVRQFTGEARGLDGQALRWCNEAELARVPLLPADRPMLRLIHLPEEIHTTLGAGYRILTSASEARPEVLTGVLCRNAIEAQQASTAAVDFVALTAALSPDELQALCWTVATPVFAFGLSLADAWLQGASGVNCLFEPSTVSQSVACQSRLRGREWPT